MNGKKNSQAISYTPVNMALIWAPKYFQQLTIDFLFNKYVSLISL